MGVSETTVSEDRFTEEGPISTGSDSEAESTEDDLDGMGAAVEATSVIVDKMGEGVDTPLSGDEDGAAEDANSAEDAEGADTADDANETVDVVESTGGGAEVGLDFGSSRDAGTEMVLNMEGRRTSSELEGTSEEAGSGMASMGGEAELGLGGASGVLVMMVDVVWRLGVGLGSADGGVSSAGNDDAGGSPSEADEGLLGEMLGTEDAKGGSSSMVENIGVGVTPAWSLRSLPPRLTGPACVEAERKARSKSWMLRRIVGGVSRDARIVG